MKKTTVVEPNIDETSSEFKHTLKREYARRAIKFEKQSKRYRNWYLDECIERMKAVSTIRKLQKNVFWMGVVVFILSVLSMYLAYQLQVL